VLLWPISGDNPKAKEIVAQLLDQIGFDSVDAGTIAEIVAATPGFSCFLTNPPVLLQDGGVRKQENQVCCRHDSADCSGVTESIRFDQGVERRFLLPWDVSRNRQSNTIATSSRTSRLRQSLRYNCVEDFDHGPPKLPLNPYTFREAVFYFIDTAVAKWVIIANHQ